MNICLFETINANSVIKRMTNFYKIISAVPSRWGSTSCRKNLAGRAGGSYYGHHGGGSNYLCMPNEPQWLSYRPGIQGHSPIYGVEYEGNIKRNSFNHNAPCAVCYVPDKTTSIMIPARTSCPSGWTREYYGYLMSAHRDSAHYRTEFVCVDLNMDRVSGTSANTHGAVFYHSEASCNGMPCGPYYPDRELTCAVCTK